jgi:hypothetical protein
MPSRSRQVSLTALAARTAPPDVVEPEAPPAGVESAAAVADPPPASPRPTASPERRSPRRKTSRPAPGEWARFDQYERKEARLRPDQYGRLSTTSRELNRARRGSGERITENTLIRVAIDLLLERGDDLTGSTEAELRKSVGL